MMTRRTSSRLGTSYLALAAVLLVTLAAVVPVSADDTPKAADAKLSESPATEVAANTDGKPADSVAVAAEGAAKTDDKPAGVGCGVDGFRCLAYAGDAALLSPRADAKTLYRRSSLGSR